MQLGTRLECVGQGYQEFARMTQGSLPEEDRDSPKDYRGKPKSLLGFGKVLKIGKLVRNTSGDHQRKIVKLTERMSEVVGLSGVTYEFGYQVARECFRVLYPDLAVEEYPFADYPEDANIPMENCLPFDDREED
ncbi:hypothetical protein BHE74_00034596 [Ensete ventricosum]|nr:hypothetical protein BHE74_00034596 [Ensete ventricosum]RZS06280.1 hypothetical protein BHM03_00036918 [Ensete ventricosum]